MNKTKKQTPKYSRYKCPECGSTDTIFDTEEWEELTGCGKLVAMKDIAVCMSCVHEWNINSGKPAFSCREDKGKWTINTETNLET